MVDIPAAIATAAKSIEIVKALRDIERDLDSSTYKVQIADLYTNLADVKMALSDANERIHELERQIEDNNSGDLCPVCNDGRLKVLRITPHPNFDFAGVKNKHVKCESCNHQDQLLYDPNSIIKS